MKYFLSLFLIIVSLQSNLAAMNTNRLTLDEYCKLQEKYTLENGFDESDHKQIYLYDTLSDEELCKIFTFVDPERIEAIRRKSTFHINVTIPHHHFDSSLFGKFANLTTLFLKRYNISDISFLTEKLSNLTHVYLDDNSIKNIEPVTQLPKLTILSLSGNDITSIEPLNKIILQLKQLDITDNPLLLEEIETLYEYYSKSNYSSEKIKWHLEDRVEDITKRDAYTLEIQQKKLKTKIKNIEKIKKNRSGKESDELIIQEWDEYD